MQLILDNLTAIIISAVLILALQVTQVRSQHAGLEQVVSHSVKAKTLVFGNWVERDILDLGANFGTNVYRFDEPTLDADSNAVDWMFFSDGVDTGGDPIRVFKRYKLEPTNVAVFSAGTSEEKRFQLYRLDRDSLVVALDDDGAPESYSESDWVPAGQSLSTLSFFKIDLIDRFGETPRDDDGALDYYSIDYVRVRFGVVPEYVLKPDNYIRELYWAKTLKIRPYWVPPPSLDG